MLKKTVLVLGSISLGILGFSPMLLSVIGKNNSNCIQVVALKKVEV